MRVSARLGIVWLAAFTVGLANPAAAYSVQDARHGAELRSEAAQFLALIGNGCGRRPALEPAEARYERLKNAIADTPYAMDIAIAEADFNLRMGMVDMLCSERPKDEQAVLDKIHGDMADRLLARMEQRVAEPRSAPAQTQNGAS